ncbi:hypothetical protein M8494_25500 [Serratia ureilytica]
MKYLKQSGQEASRYQLTMCKNLLAAVGGGDDADGAVVHLRPLRSAPMGIRAGPASASASVLRADQIFGPLSLVAHAAGAKRFAAGMLFLLISVYMLLKRK